MTPEVARSIEASCHCGTVRITVAGTPQSVTDCNCSICRRLGALWAYFDPADVDMGGAQATVAYVRHDGPDQGRLGFHHCPTCGCTTHWRNLDPQATRMGVNARMIDPTVLKGIRVRRLDGASTWKDLDEA